PREPRAKKGRKPQGGPRRHQSGDAVRALASMAQRLLEVEGVDELARPLWIEGTVDVPLHPGADLSKASNALVQRILERVHEVRAHESALVPGHAYCYRSDSPESARPSSVRHVFDGFQSTGRPLFADFVTLAIERRDPGFEELVNGQDVIVTHVSMGRVLR